MLSIARCEVKELSGILAFEKLEELYCSHNFIDSLFDVGFLDKLKILDVEGNDIKTLDNIYSLRPLMHIYSFNCQSNPVTKELTYVKIVQEVLPNIIYLDDDYLSATLYEYEYRQKE